MPQWYKSMLKQMNDKLLDHQGIKKQKKADDDDFPLIGQDKKINAKLDPKTPKPEAPKKPASTIDMDWIARQKEALKQKK